MIQLVRDLIKNEPLYLQILIIGLLIFMSVNMVVITFSRFLEALDYLKKSLISKLKAMIKAFYSGLKLIIKVFLFPITLARLVKENKELDKYIYINVEDKELVKCESVTR